MYGYVNVGERRLPADGEADGADARLGRGDRLRARRRSRSARCRRTRRSTSSSRRRSTLQTDKFISQPDQHRHDQRQQLLQRRSPVENNRARFADARQHRLSSTPTQDGMFDAGEGVVGVALEPLCRHQRQRRLGRGRRCCSAPRPRWRARRLQLRRPRAGRLYRRRHRRELRRRRARSRTCSSSPGVAADPDDNVDNDNNGVAARRRRRSPARRSRSPTTMKARASRPARRHRRRHQQHARFRLLANQPPVANDDSVTVAEDSGANDLTAQLLANDTDPENDTQDDHLGDPGHPRHDQRRRRRPHLHAQRQL